jgi:hypothetical protein
MRGWALVAGAILAAIIAAQFFTVFVVQPLGALPDGRTLIITRLTNVNFVDSADAICARKMGGVSILCRAAVLGRVGKEATIIARLPYFSMLYAFSTGGKAYDR